MSVYFNFHGFFQDDRNNLSFTVQNNCLLVTYASAPPDDKPQIDVVCPTFGPEAGGTDMFIWGKRLSIISHGESGTFLGHT